MVRPPKKNLKRIREGELRRIQGCDDIAPGEKCPKKGKRK